MTVHGQKMTEAGVKTGRGWDDGVGSVGKWEVIRLTGIDGGGGRRGENAVVYKRVADYFELSYGLFGGSAVSTLRQGGLEEVAVDLGGEVEVRGV